MLNKLKQLRNTNEEGFTLIELLVVIVIIGILAAIALPIFLNQQKAANEAAQKQDLKRIETAITAAKMYSGNASLLSVTQIPNHAGECAQNNDPATLAKTHNCWVNYDLVLDRISTVSKVDIRGLVDPYGRPYIINPNEKELSATDCRNDSIGYYSDKYVWTAPVYTKNLPMTTGACS